MKSIIYDVYDDNMVEKHYQEWQISVLNECYRVLKDGHCLFYNHKNRYIDKGLISPIQWISKTKFNIRQEIIWDKMIAANIRGWRFWNVDERIYWLQKGKATEISPKIASKSSIWRIKPQEKSKFQHPCGFPLKLAETCISTLNEPRCLVLDPFMGSGTTAIAAIILNHNYIGFEISKEYCEIAEKRILAEKSQTKIEF